MAIDNADHGQPVVEGPASTCIVSDSPAAQVQIRRSQRKLHRGHFGFMRAWVQGLDPVSSYARYLSYETGRTDIRSVRSTVNWLKDEFAAAARRRSRHGVARLVRFDAEAIPEHTSVNQPSLNEFAASRGLLEFSEQEQLEAYRAEFGTTPGNTNRRRRLILKQLEAIAWLESVAAEPPHADDEVGAWFPSELAIRIQGIGIQTIRQLVQRINGIGNTWYRAIKGIGPEKASRIQHWLEHHSDDLKLHLNWYVAMPRSKLRQMDLQAVVKRGTAIVPIEKFVAPVDLSGATGRYRAPAAENILGVTNDHDAILSFVRSKPGLPAERIAERKSARGIDPTAPAGQFDWLQHLTHTQRAYLKETERLLLWAVIERGKALSSLNTEDCIAYVTFLSDPQPAERWCGPRARQRWSPLWKPFEGRLSVSARRRAITILKTFFKYLADQRYLVGNPFAGIGKPRPDHPEIDVGRSFTEEQWAFINRRLDALEPTSANLRLRIGLRIAYAGRLRRAELLNSRVGDLTWVSYPPTEDDPETIETWLLHVIGKGSKPRSIPLPPNVIEDLSDYLCSRGLSPHISAQENKPAYLLGKATDVAIRAPWSNNAKRPVSNTAGISDSTFYAQLKAFFKQTANELRSANPAGADHLAKASAHWLRHTGISHSLAAGTDMDIERQIAGHGSLKTLSIYSHVEDRRRAKGMAKFWAKTNQGH